MKDVSATVQAIQPLPLLIRDPARLPSPLNFHVLFHPPTYESEYTETPYWDGKRRSDSTAYYVKLGIRYLAEDFKAVAHHVMAVAEREPNLAYVVPVADSTGNFGDLLSPVAFKAVLTEIYDFLARHLNAGKAPQFDTIGRVIVSGYSRSGNRLVALMANQSGPAKSFFENHLAQVNAFDINLGNNDDERLPEFTKLWQSLRDWITLNPRGRAYIYTAYRSHYNIANMTPIAPMRGWDDRTDVNLESPQWSNPALKGKVGQVRGMASDQYTSDPSSAWCAFQSASSSCTYRTATRLSAIPSAVGLMGPTTSRARTATAYSCGGCSPTRSRTQTRCSSPSRPAAGEPVAASRPDRCPSEADSVDEEGLRLPAKRSRAAV